MHDTEGMGTSGRAEWTVDASTTIEDAQEHRARLSVDALKVRDAIDHAFTYHAPTERDIAKYAEIRSFAKNLAESIADLCPVSEDRAHAIRCVREAVMWANAAIACGGVSP